MGRLIDCQMAVVSWGERAKFRRAKVGLLRKASLVYIAIFTQSKNTHYKFPIDPSTIELLPAAIRFKDLQKDLFIRQVSDDKQYSTMMREIKVLLKKDKLRQSGKGDTLDKLISNIPLFSAIKPCELVPNRVSARLIANDMNDDVDMLYADQEQQSQSSAVTATSDNIYTLQGLAKVIDSTNSKATISEHLVTLSKEDRKRLGNRQLRSIEISRIHILPMDLWSKDSLHKLTLTDCNLTTIPKQLEHFSATLTSLDLTRNKITELPRSFCCKMVHLQELNLSYNLLETLPIEIKFFRRLYNLNIENNRLRMLPSTFSDLKHLAILNVSHNNLSQLPAFRKDEIRLKQLDVSFNPLDGASDGFNTFEVYPCYDGPLGYQENRFSPPSADNQLESQRQSSKSKLATLFETTLLSVVRNDELLKWASEEPLPRTIVSTMQRDIFKCFTCQQMNILPAYNSTDILDYVEQVETLTTTGNYRHGMTFMKLMCRTCFHGMSSR